MTREEAIATIERMDSTLQIAWMIALGMELTIAARGAAYEVGTKVADGTKLRGFNEIQHQVYGRIRHTQAGHVWTAESFIAVLVEKGCEYGISDEVQRAITWTISRALA